MNAYRVFIQNEIRAFKRSSLFEQKLVVNILISLGLFFAFVQFGALGFILAYSFKTVSSQTLVILFLSFYLTDLVIKLIFLRPPSGLLYSYLVLPIAKKKLVTYSVTKLLIHFTTLTMLFFWIPFLSIVKGVTMEFFVWISLVIAYAYANSLIVCVAKTSLSKGVWLLSGVLTLAIGSYLLSAFEIVDISLLTERYFSGEFLIQKLLFHLLILAGVLLMLYLSIKGQLYLHTSVQTESMAKSSGKSSFDLGYEWKLLWRNSRYRNTFLIQTFFLGGNFIFQSINISNGKSEPVESTFIMCGIFIWMLTSAMAFGQFCFKAESGFMSKYLSIPLRMDRILTNKLYFSMIMLSICALLVSPMTFFYANAWKYIAASFVFHVGFTSYLFMYSGTFSKSLFEINGRTLFNYQGAEFTFHLPDVFMFAELLLVPLLVYLSARTGMLDVFLLVLGVSGLVSMAMGKRWHKLIIENFRKRKYMMYSGILEH